MRRVFLSSTHHPLLTSNDADIVAVIQTGRLVLSLTTIFAQAIL